MKTFKMQYTQWYENHSKCLNLQHCERSENAKYAQNAKKAQIEKMRKSQNYTKRKRKMLKMRHFYTFLNAMFTTTIFFVNIKKQSAPH